MKTCVHGHKMTKENTYVTPAGYAQCRQCRRDAAGRHRDTDHGRESKNALARDYYARKRDGVELKHRRHKHVSTDERTMTATRMMWYLYGLTPDEYDAILLEQEGVCAICQGPPSGKFNPRFPYHVDHCKDTGVVRGLLCFRCNVGIGNFKHDPQIIDRAAHYFKNAKPGRPITTGAGVGRRKKRRKK